MFPGLVSYVVVDLAFVVPGPVEFVACVFRGFVATVSDSPVSMLPEHSAALIGALVLASVNVACVSVVLVSSVLSGVIVSPLFVASTFPGSQLHFLYLV